jgi:hypothetical protein
MPSPTDLIKRGRMFEERAEQAADPISRQHYREMAAHYRSLAVEHQETRASPEHEFEHGKMPHERRPIMFRTIGSATINSVTSVRRPTRFTAEPHIREQGPRGHALRTIAERLPH